MRILVVARHPGGGIKTYLRYVFQNAAMAEIEVLLITPEVADKEFFQDAFRVRFFEHQQCSQSKRDLFISVKRAIDAWKPDVVHSHGFTAGLCASLSARLHQVPHILTIHDVLMPNQFRGVRGQLKKFAVGRLLAVPDVLNPVGDDAAQNLIETYPLLQTKTAVRPIRNGIDSQYFSSDRVRDVRGELGIHSERILIGFFGRFMAQKGFSVLRDAVVEINLGGDGPKLEVACFGWGGFIREEQSELSKLGVDQWFHFLPNTNDMVAAIRGVDAVVMPSRWEACPLLPMEVMVSGTTAIASDCIGMKEVTKGTPALTFPVDDVTALVQHLKCFANDRVSYSKVAESFRNSAAKRFDVQATVDQVFELYQGLAVKHIAGPC